MEKENLVYTYNGMLFSLKKKKILSYATTRMNLQDIMLSKKWNRPSQKDTAWSHLHEVSKIE